MTGPGKSAIKRPDGAVLRGTPLDPAELIATARAATGLTEFDGPDVVEPLERMAHSLATEARLSDLGVQFWRLRLLNVLETRLRAGEWFRRHPEILAQTLPPVVVVLGLARTGTTLLHRAIGADQRFYSAAWWEVRFPVPQDDDIGGARRIAAAKAEVASILEHNPELASIHPWDAMQPDEDIMLLDQTLMSTMTEALANVPGYREWLHSLDLRPAYDYLLRLLKLLQWQKIQRGQRGERWVLKSPMHLGYVDVLRELWPESTFVQTHRDPATSFPSYASFIANLWRGTSDAVDASEAARQWTDTLDEHLHRCLEVREGRDAARFVDVDFRDTVRAPLDVIERIYASIELPLTETARTQITTYLQSHPRESRPKHEYSLEQFGYTREQLESRFRRYRERYIKERDRQK